MASTIKTISNLIYGLEDALSFMETFDEYAEESFGCICGKEHDEDMKACECITEEGHLRVTSKEKILEDARKLLAELKEEEENKFYKRYDLQDESDYSIETLQEMRTWLADFWTENPDEDMDDGDVDELVKEILQSDSEELFERLSGIDYSFYELDENEEVIPQEIMQSAMYLSHGHSIIAEKRNVVEFTVTKGKEKKTFNTTPDKWQEVFHEHADILSKEVKQLNLVSV